MNRCDQLTRHLRRNACPLGLPALRSVINSPAANSVDGTAASPVVINSHAVNLLDGEALMCSL